MTEPTSEMFVELDGRRRASLGQLAKHDRYLARLHPDGVITLEPVVLVPVSELPEVAQAFLANPASGIRHPRSTRRSRPSRSELAETVEILSDQPTMDAIAAGEADAAAGRFADEKES